MKDFFVRFWGVRGSIACPGQETVRYGGNTSCLEMRCGDRLLIFDAGTGVHVLGKQLANHNPISADLFITHTHIDHISGFPFFGPAYYPDNAFKIWGGHDYQGMGIKADFQRLMQAPFFPVPLEIMRAEINFIDFEAGDTLPLTPDITVRTAPLNHPGNATGYRVEYQGKSICYVTDTEHYPDKLDPNILTLIQGANILIYDASYTDEEYSKFRGWGHSTWQEGIKLCNAAGVHTFVASHHAPQRDDVSLDTIAAEMEKVRPGSIVAREGMVLHP